MVTARGRVAEARSLPGNRWSKLSPQKPLSDLDRVGGTGPVNGDAFVHVIYTTL